MQKIHAFKGDNKFEQNRRKKQREKKTQTEINKKRGYERESTMAATICCVEALSDKLGR